MPQAERRGGVVVRSWVTSSSDHATAPAGDQVLTTPDGRYIVVRGRLWRASNPALSSSERQAAVGDLMAARRAIKLAGAQDLEALRAARSVVDATKRRLGERGAPWWTDGAPDLNRRLVRNTPYAGWYASVVDADGP